MHFCGNPWHDAPLALALLLVFRRRIGAASRWTLERTIGPAARRAFAWLTRGGWGH